MALAVVHTSAILLLTLSSGSGNVRPGHPERWPVLCCRGGATGPAAGGALTGGRAAGGGAESDVIQIQAPLLDANAKLGAPFRYCAGKGTWSVGRCTAAEEALQGRPLTARLLVDALRAAVQGLGEDAYPLMAQLTEGILLTSLAPLVEQVGKGTGNMSYSHSEYCPVSVARHIHAMCSGHDACRRWRI